MTHCAANSGIDALVQGGDRAGQPSPFVTVEQAAEVLQLGRSKAYELTVEFEASAGRSGLPFVRLCGCHKRVPRNAIARLMEGSTCGGRPLPEGRAAPAPGGLDSELTPSQNYRLTGAGHSLS